MDKGNSYITNDGSKINLVHIKIEGELNYSSKSFVATANLSIKLGNDVKELLLEASSFSILSIKIDDDMAAYSYDMEIIHIEIPKKYRGKEVNVGVGYVVTDPKEGLHFITKDKYGPSVQNQVWSTGEGQTKHFEVVEENRYWFPNVSGPSTKCTSETIITVPKEQEVISNGELLNVGDLGDRRRFHWKMDTLHSTYLISIVAGEFDSKVEQFNNVKLMYYVPRGRKQDIDRAFHSTKDFLEFFGKYTGIQYPYSKFAQTCVYGAPFGGMENITANTLTERMLHDERAHLDYNYEENVGHHMAHQWFGNIVTCKTWEDVWLNESFAIFAYAQYLNYKYGENDYQYYYLEKIDYLTETKNILGGEEVCSTYSDNPRQSFGRYNIEKGAIVLSSLTNLLGEEIFRKAIGRYFSEFKYGAASTGDFQNVVTETFGQDLDWFFGEFVYARGFPELHVDYYFSEKEKVLRIKFEQKQQTPRAYRLKLRVATSMGSLESKEGSVELNGRSETLSVPCDSEPKFVCIDPDQSIVGKVEVEESLEESLAKIKSDRHLVCRIRAIRRLKSSYGKEIIMAMSDILDNKDEHWSIASEAARILGSIASEDSFNILKRYSQHIHPKVRKSIVSSIGEFKTKQAYDLLQTLLRMEKSYYVIGEILHSLGKTGLMESMGTLIKGLKEYSHGDAIAIGSIRGIAKLGTEMGVRELLRVSQSSPNNKLRLVAIQELSFFVEDSNVKSSILRMIESDDQEIRETSFDVALKSKDRDFINEAKNRFLSRYYTEYSMTWVA